MNNIKRLQQLAGINEWKIQQPPLFRKGQEVELWGNIKGTIIDIVKGYNNISSFKGELLWTLNVKRNEEIDDYYYLIVYTEDRSENKQMGEVVISESWLKQNSAGLNEWKIQQPPLFRKGQELVINIAHLGFAYSPDKIEKVPVVVGDISKGIPPKEEWGIWAPIELNPDSEEEINGYYYWLEYSDLSFDYTTIWVSEELLKSEQDTPLNEWKVNSPAATLDDLDKYGSYWENDYGRYYIVDEDIYANWMDEYFPEWYDNGKIKMKGNKIFFDGISKAAKAKYGEDINVRF